MRVLLIVAIAFAGLETAAAQGVDKFDTDSDCLEVFNTGCGYLYAVNDCDAVTITLDDWPLTVCAGRTVETRGSETIEESDCELPPHAQAEGVIEMGAELQLSYQEVPRSDDRGLGPFTAIATVACEEAPGCSVSATSPRGTPFGLAGLLGLIGLRLTRRR